MNNFSIDIRSEPYQKPSISIQQVKDNFRQNIRKRQVRDKLKQMREQILMSTSEDYFILKDINLNETVRLLGEINLKYIQQDWKSVQLCINHLFKYSCSNQSDHLFYLFNQRSINQLIEIASWHNMSLFSDRPILYIQLFYIITHYAEYAQEMPRQYYLLLRTIFQEFVINSNIYQDKIDKAFFNYIQIKSLTRIMLYGLSHLNLMNQGAFEWIISHQNGLGLIALKEGYKLLNIVKQHQLNQFSKENEIIISLLNLLQKILACNRSDEKQRQQLFDIDIQIVDFLLEFLGLPTEQLSLLQEQLIIILNKFLMEHLTNSPQILLSHNFRPLMDKYEISCNKIISFLSNTMKDQGAPKQVSDKLFREAFENKTVMMQYINTIILIFGISVPDQRQKQAVNPYYELLEEWLEDYVMPSIARFFSQHDGRLDRITYKLFMILEDLCCDQIFIQYVLDQLSVVSKIFYHCQQNTGNASLRKSALQCLSAMIRMAYDGDCQFRQEIAQFINANNAIELIADSVGDYYQASLNLSLLQAMKYWLWSESLQFQGDSYIWSRFKAAGGAHKLERLLELQDNQNSKVYNIIHDLLNRYNINNEL